MERGCHSPSDRPLPFRPGGDVERKGGGTQHVPRLRGRGAVHCWASSAEAESDQPDHRRVPVQAGRAGRRSGGKEQCLLNFWGEREETLCELLLVKALTVPHSLGPCWGDLPGKKAPLPSGGKKEGMKACFVFGEPVRGKKKKGKSPARGPLLVEAHRSY